MRPHFAALALAGFLLARCAPAPESSAPPAGPLASLPPAARAKAEVARQAVQAFGAEMRQTLSAAIDKGGATLAIEVCKTEAPRIASQHAARIGGSIGRTSLGLRNESNAPDDWEIETMEKLSALIRAGSDPTRLESAEVVSPPGGQPVLRYAKPIVMDTLCVTCHGAVIAGPIQAKIDTLYPGDKGAGFKEGELRGIFTVTLPLGTP